MIVIGDNQQLWVSDIKFPEIIGKELYKNDTINIMGIGIGKGLDEASMREMVSDESYFFDAREVSGWPMIAAKKMEKIIQEIPCKGKKNKYLLTGKKVTLLYKN